MLTWLHGGSDVLTSQLKRPGVDRVVAIRLQDTNFMRFIDLIKMNENQYWSMHVEVVPPQKVREMTESGDTTTKLHHAGAEKKKERERPSRFRKSSVEEAESVNVVREAIQA